MFSFEAYLKTFFDWEKRLAPAATSDFSLDRVDRLLRAFGQPDDKLRFVHIAGSKGKGSTCAFLAYILRAAGYRVGLYTSPHLYSVNERIRVLEPDGVVGRGRLFEGAVPVEELSERARFYQEPVERLRVDEGVGVTYFEYLTALAMSWFARRKVDIVVLETGLGGRLDATNVVETMVCGIASLGLEHVQILGKSLAEIAGEKAGIIKSPLQKVVLAPQQPEAMEVLQAKCRELGIVPSEVGKDIKLVVREISSKGSCFDVTGRRFYRGLRTALAGEHQAWNAALALAMAEDLEMYGFRLSEETAEKGLDAAAWPARFEIFSGSPVIVLDAAHTKESAKALTETFLRVFPGRRCILVFGSSTDKNAAGMARELMPIVDRVVLTRADHERARDPQEIFLSGIFSSMNVSVAADIPLALDVARDLAGQEGIVLVCGSIFLCAQARALICGEKDDE